MSEIIKNRLLFLGTGSSAGVPVIGCQCRVCLSTCSFNKRLRPSVKIEYGGKRFLVDVGPDFRQQALLHQISNMDGVLLTHAHYDHVAGIDDLRPFYFRRKTPLPILLSAETASEVKSHYHYLFHSKQNQAEPRMDLKILPSRAGQIDFIETSIRYVTYEQAGMKVNGYCIGDLAYLSDIRHFSESIFDELKGVRYLIISALRYTHSDLHFSVDEAIEFATKFKAEKVWLTHLSHDLDHEQTNAYLPTNIRLAYDGLEIEF